MNKSITIRYMRRDDVGVCLEVLLLNYPSGRYIQKTKLELQSMFNGRPTKPTFFVAERSSEVIGFAGVVQSLADNGLYEVLWVNVLPDYQRIGIGKALMKRLIEVVVSKKGNFLLLSALDWREEYYRENFGFRSVSEKNGEHIMILDL